jgi:hypothetical protein
MTLAAAAAACVGKKYDRMPPCAAQRIPALRIAHFNARF